jgi:hypothetical protein
MPTKEICITQIERVKEALHDADTAYLARTRLRRLILSCGRLLARTYNLQEPKLPQPIRVLSKASSIAIEMSECCNRLLEAANLLSQPSEPLDDRWRSEWRSVIRNLDTIEQLVSQL